MSKIYFTLFIFIILSLNNLSKAQSELWGLNAGGGNGFGTLYSLPTGSNGIASQYNFSGNAGFNPNYTKLIEATNGKLYGMTSLGGVNKGGVLFEYDTLSNIYTWKMDFGGLLGANPQGALMQAANGKLYGMTQRGGTNNLGVLFEYDNLTNIYNVLVNFSGNTGASPGSQPYGTLLQPDAGITKLYGMTSAGGSGAKGVLFEYNYATNTYVSKFDFTGNVGLFQGSNPYGGLTKAVSASSSSTTVFGLTRTGGAANEGVLFEYDYLSNTFVKRYDFNSAVTGSTPQGSLLLASNGRLYGTAYDGAVNFSGVVFEYIISTNTYNSLTVLNSGLGSIGGYPSGDLIENSPNKLFGLTAFGGANDQGAVFEYDVTTPATPVYSKKLDFATAIGAEPYGSLIKVSTGKLYGLTSTGGANGATGGVLFQFNASNSVYVKKVDLNMSTNGGYPNGNLTQANNGKLYGMTSVGGTGGVGVIFEYDRTTSTYTKRRDFTNIGGANPGSTPLGSLIQAANGKLYGMTSAGGISAGFGSIFSYDIGTNTHSVLTSLTGNAGVNPGNGPFGSLVEHSNGKLYGTVKQGGGAPNLGVIFEFNPITNAYVKTVNFSAVNGYSALGSMVQSGTKLYGMAQLGGANSLGVIFGYDPSISGPTSYTKIVDFSGTAGVAPGSFPTGSLVKTATVGVLYGMTKSGGANDLGVIFEFNALTNSYTKKYDFTGTDGSLPQGSLILAANGKLYGVANSGGANGRGVYFEYDITSGFTKKMDFTIASGTYPMYTQFLEVCTKPLTPVAITSSTNSVCQFDGSTKSFSISTIVNATEYMWTLPAGASITSGSTITNITTNLAGVAAGTYTCGVSGVNVCGTGTLSIGSITVNALPTVTVNSGPLCAGSTFTIVPGGASTYSVQGNSFQVSPPGNTTYTLTGLSAAGCLSSNTATSAVTVNAVPTIGVNSGSICVGQSFIMVPTGVVTSTPSGGALTVAPVTTTFYTIVGTDGNGCVSANTATSNVTVNLLPTISVANATMCSGKSATLTPTGAGVGGTYTSSILNGAGPFFVSPGATTTFTFAGSTSFGCASTNTPGASVTVYTLPIISVANTTMCASIGATLTPTGAGAGGTYTSGVLNGAGPFAVNPGSTTTFSFSGTTALGCVSSATAGAPVTVYTLPVISVNSPTMCAGISATIVPTGAGVAGTYTVGVLNGAGSFSVSPGISTNYNVSGTSSLGCISSNTPIAAVTVYTLPVLSVNNPTMCVGKSATISPTGAGVSGTYTVGLANGAGPFVVNPGVSTNYNVSGTSSLGCVSSNIPVSAVTVFTLPVISVASGTICAGSTFTFIPTGASSYTMLGPISGTAFPVSPSSSSSYTIAGTGAAGCISSLPATANVTVYALPVVSVNSASVCAGQAALITPSGAGASATYTVGSFMGAGPFNVSPSITTSYGVGGTSSLGCVSINTPFATVTVVSLPTIIANNGVICFGNAFTTTVSGATGNYTFASSTQTIYTTGTNTTVAPAITTTYLVTGANTNGCVSIPAVMIVTVNPLPLVSITGTSSICDGQTTTLAANGATNYNWGTSTNAILVVNPNTNTSYSVVGTDLNNCSNTGFYTLTVNPLPTITVISGAICPGNCYTLTPGGATTYTYSGGSAIVCPTTTSTYSVSGSSAFGCASIMNAVATVSVVNILTVTISGNTSICNGGTVNLTANGASTYTWNTSVSTNTFAASPTSSTTYSVLGASGTCSSTASISITVNQLPNVVAVATPTFICLNESAGINGTGAVSYSCNTSSTSQSFAVSPTITSVYSVIGTDVNNCVNTATVSLEVGQCVGIQKYSGNVWEYGVYPNPNAGEFVIETSATISITILNALGQPVFSKQLTEGKNAIDLNNQAKGIYFVQLKNGSSTKIIKVIKQ